ncbi:MAG: cytochrome c oxidase assembly protein [Actinomycetota bacterium]|nr:cytochrome c oxidase assembly protein [Actinomycetota bacterium]
MADAPTGFGCPAPADADIVIAPSTSSVFTGFIVSPLGDGLILLATVLYALMVGRLRRAGGHWPLSRSIAWGGAVVALLIAIDSSVAIYSDSLFWVHMIQHLLLIMVVPVLVVLAEPLRLGRVAGGRPGRYIVVLLETSRVWRVLTVPLVAIGLYTLTLVVTHLTGFQQLMHRQMIVPQLEMVIYLISGYLVFLSLVGNEISPWKVPYLFRFALLALTTGVDTIVGVVLMLTAHPLAPGFAAERIGWGPTALADQLQAGAVMWFGGDGLMMILMVVTAIQWGTRRHQDEGLGTWLEGVRRRQLLGDEAATAGSNVDDDQRALDAYNAQLAALAVQKPSAKPRANPLPRTNRS